LFNTTVASISCADLSYDRALRTLYFGTEGDLLLEVCIYGPFYYIRLTDVASFLDNLLAKLCLGWMTNLVRVLSMYFVQECLMLGIPTKASTP